ncbi:hypothetical protein [Actinomadura opuntiae]|uniref:hypothetical protein n=1 Tax=Actinomadura sp. OS1-43 TaxID=604315 RepID=UPI00255AEBAB|nr:hypothetical protein [Actinomadura sp. OS1-43]MDL4812781.1 hypothetical protein [Actinomadura sp. OS1-43]
MTNTANTTTTDRDQLNKVLQFQADMAADKLAEVQKETAGRLANGELLDWSALEKLATAQAEAQVWAKATQIREFWANDPSKAPEHADLVEAADRVRTEALREVLSYRGRTSSSGMSNELEQAMHLARQDFVRRTGQIYPEGSPLRELGKF